jgi:molybdenum cofactor biosynthesis protein B
MPADEHRQCAHKVRKAVTCAIVTVSDTRTPDTDTSGQTMREKLETAGHTVAYYRIVKDEPALIRGLIEELAAAGTVQAVLVNGGTGISRRDATYEALDALLEKRLDGFGELFRMLSYQEIGAAAMLSRAVAGTYRDLVVFSTPGSTPAVRLAMEKLIVPELPHLVWEIWR